MKRIIERKYYGFLFPLFSIVVYAVSSFFVKFSLAVMYSFLSAIVLAMLGVVYYLRNDYVDVDKLFEKQNKDEARQKAHSEARFEETYSLASKIDEVNVWIEVPGKDVKVMYGTYLVRLDSITRLLKTYVENNELKSNNIQYNNINNKQMNTEKSDELVICPYCGSRIRPMKNKLGELVCPICFGRLTYQEVPSPKLVKQLVNELIKQEKKRKKKVSKDEEKHD
ncbi:MAG: hypothetical protein J7K23_00970 [Thermoproteales archaeon]|nr:hypothetical protein [Thermoproteales archaeon]